MPPQQFGHFSLRERTTASWSTEEAAAGAEFREDEPVLVGQGNLPVQDFERMGDVGLDSAPTIAQLGDDGEDRDLVKGHFIEGIRHLDLQMAFGIERCLDLVGLEAETPEPLPVVAGNVADLAGDIGEFLIGQGQALEVRELLPERRQEGFVIDFGGAVVELEVPSASG